MVKMHGVCREVKFLTAVKKTRCILSTLACFAANTAKMLTRFLINSINIYLGSPVQSGTS